MGYQFNPYFSTEIAYQYLGKAYTSYNDDMVTGNFHQSVLSASLGYPLFSGVGALTPYLKVGGAVWTGGNRSADGFSPVYGAGLSWLVSEDLRLRLEYQITDGLSGENTRFGNNYLTSLGFSWRFGHSQRPIKVVEVPLVTERIVEQKIHVFSSNVTGALFANNSSVLVMSKEMLSVVNTLNKHPNALVVITGYTDNTGSIKYNQWLSEKRAQVAADWLITHGIKNNRIAVVGRGKADPIADNHTTEGRAMNRRVEINIQGQSKVSAL